MLCVLLQSCNVGRCGLSHCCNWVGLLHQCNHRACLETRLFQSQLHHDLHTTRSTRVPETKKNTNGALSRGACIATGSEVESGLLASGVSVMVRNSWRWCVQHFGGLVATTDQRREVLYCFSARRSPRLIRRRCICRHAPVSDSRI